MQPTPRVLGVDCGEAHHHLILLSATGDSIVSKRVPNQREVLVRTLRAFRESDESEERTEIALEGLYGFSALVAEVARDLGFVIWQVNSKALDHYRDLEGQPHKDDERDAYLLARMVWQKLNGCRLALSPTPEEQALRRISRLHRKLTEQRKKARQRLRSRLIELCPDLFSKDWKGPKYASDTFLAILERWPGLEGLERARLPSIRRVLSKVVRNRSAETLARQSQALKELASLASPASTERQIITLELSCLVEEIRTASASLCSVDSELERLVRADPVAQKLEKMPGVGWVTAATWTGELRPLARTSSEGQVATYAGLTPLNRHSGSSSRHKLAKGVNKHAQQACYMSALASLQHSSLDNAYYRKQHDRHRGHPKPHVVALLALARQRLKVVYKLLTTDAVYDPEILISSHLRRLEEQREQRAA